MGAPRHRGWALTAIVIAAALIRAHALPGDWNDDARYYVETLLGHVEPLGTSNRDFRYLFKALVGAGLTVAGDRPWGACLPSVVLGVATVPLTYLAARRPLGSDLALLPAAIVAVLPVLLAETTQPSADGPLAAFGAAALWLAGIAAAPDEPHRMRHAFALGATMGVGIVFKELFVLAALPLGIWFALATLRQRLALRSVLVTAGVAAAIVLADQAVSMWIAGGGGRFGLIDRRMTTWHADVPLDPTRLLVGPLPAMLTDVTQLGPLFLLGFASIGLALTGRGRGEAALWMTIGGALAVGWFPTSLSRATFLTTTHAARYLLGVLPAAAIALFLPFVQPPPGRWRGAAVAIWGVLITYVAWPRPVLTASVIVGIVALIARRDPDRRVVYASALATGCVAAMGPSSGPWIGVALSAPVVVLSLAHRPLRLTPAISAAALVACGTAVHVSRTPDRARAHATWDLHDRVSEGTRVFASVRLSEFLRIAGARQSNTRLRIYSRYDLAQHTPPLGMRAGDVAVVEVPNRFGLTAPDLTTAPGVFESSLHEGVLEIRKLRD